MTKKASVYDKRECSIVGVRESSQDFAGKVSKICRYVKWGLREDGSKAANTIQLSHRKGHAQRDEW